MKYLMRSPLCPRYPVSTDRPADMIPHPKRYSNFIFTTQWLKLRFGGITYTILDCEITIFHGRITISAGWIHIFDGQTTIFDGFEGPILMVSKQRVHPSPWPGLWYFGTVERWSADPFNDVWGSLGAQFHGLPRKMIMSGGFSMSHYLIGKWCWFGSMSESSVRPQAFYLFFHWIRWGL